MISLSDYLVACYTRHLARGITTASSAAKKKVNMYLYEFHHTPSPGADIVFGNMKECGVYPCHASDNIFNFDSVNLIEGLPFKQALFSIWLGEVPAQESLKEEMLGN